MRSGTYQDLVAWRKAFELGVSVYGLSNQLPFHERYGLTSQLRRGGVAVASNIAEGYGRGSRADYVRFSKIARGALYELDTQLLYSRRFEDLTEETSQAVKSELDETVRTLAHLIRSLGSR